jgi:hypothetical protein
MKIILSRKGFDSAYGGHPSPILPDGRLISFPIPSKHDGRRYGELKINEKQTYLDLMEQLIPKKRIWFDKEWHELNKKTKCHLDPDIYPKIVKRRVGWKPCFGQDSQAQSHLSNLGVKKDDLFLFFGWFKKTILKNGILKFTEKASDQHITFGYFQIGDIKPVNKNTNIPNWMENHPHANNDKLKEKINNTIYVSNDHLSWDKRKPGAGVFKFNEKLILTKEGCSRSKWELPNFFKNINISYHSKKSWKPEDYFKSADIGQEFVIEDSVEVENWAKQLIEIGCQ